MTGPIPVLATQKPSGRYTAAAGREPRG